MKELASIFPKHNVKLLGEVISIKCFPVKHLPEVFEHLELFNFLLTTLSTGQTEAILGAIQYALANKGEKLVAAILGVLEITTGKPREWLEELDYDLVAQLFAEVVEANKDFFKKFGATAKELVVAPKPKTALTGNEELLILSEED